MGRWKLWFALRLLTVCVDSNETGHQLVKHGGEPDATPICTNTTEHIITLIVCKIHTERSGEECRLLYRYGEGFLHECDSRFRLMMENQTVFLHLTSLTPVDSGNYTCQCSHTAGTDILHLNITVEADEGANLSTEMPFIPVIIGVFIFIIIAGVILGFILTKIHLKRQPEPPTIHANTEPEVIEPYLTYSQSENALYSTVVMH